MSCFKKDSTRKAEVARCGEGDFWGASFPAYFIVTASQASPCLLSCPFQIILHVSTGIFFLQVQICLYISLVFSCLIIFLSLSLLTQPQNPFQAGSAFLSYVSFLPRPNFKVPVTWTPVSQSKLCFCSCSGLLLGPPKPEFFSTQFHLQVYSWEIFPRSAQWGSRTSLKVLVLQSLRIIDLIRLIITFMVPWPVSPTSFLGRKTAFQSSLYWPILLCNWCSVNPHGENIWMNAWPIV